MTPELFTLPDPSGDLRISELDLGQIAWAAVCVVLDEADAPGLLSLTDDVHLRLAHRGLESSVLAGGTDRAVDDVVARVLARGWLPDQVGLLGLGSGGRLVLRAASRHRLGAAVSWYPSDDGHDLLPPFIETSDLLTPWLGIFRAAARIDETSGVPAWIEGLRRTTGTHARVAHYRELAGPTESSGASPAADAALFDAWQRTNEWFDQRLEPTPSELEIAFRSRSSCRT